MGNEKSTLQLTFHHNAACSTRGILEIIITYHMNYVFPGLLEFNRYSSWDRLMGMHFFSESQKFGVWEFLSLEISDVIINQALHMSNDT